MALSVATLGTAPAIIGGIGLAFASISALKSIYDVGKKIRDTMQFDERLNKEFEKARKLIGDLRKIEPMGPRTMSDTLKQFKNFANAKELARQLGVIAGGAKAVGI